MDWLRSWTQTAEQRCTEAVQKILSQGELSDTEWSNFMGDISKEEIPASLIGGLPSLLEALLARETEGRSVPVTRCRLLTAISRAATNPAHAAILVQNDAVPQVLAQWQKDTDLVIVTELLGALQNLVLLPAGSEAFATADGLQRVFTELDRGTAASKVECKVHMLSVIANTASNNEFAAFQIARGDLPLLIGKFRSNLNRFAIGAFYNVMAWENARRIIQASHKAAVKDALVQALGDIVLESCEGKSLEYCLAARIVAWLEKDPEGTPPQMAKFPWNNQPIFSGGSLET